MRRSVSKPRVAGYHHTHRAPCSPRKWLSDNDKETTKGRIRPNFERRNRSRPANQASAPRAHPFHHAQNTKTQYASGILTKKKDTGSPRHVRGRPPFLESVSQKGNPQACRSLRVLKSVQRKQNAGEQKRPKTGWSPLCKWAAPEGPPKNNGGPSTQRRSTSCRKPPTRDSSMAPIKKRMQLHQEKCLASDVFHIGCACECSLNATPRRKSRICGGRV